MGQIRGFLVLFVVFALVFATRVGFNIYPEHFSDSESYYILRQVESIKTTGVPIQEDRLGYEGKAATALPAYDYLLAGASLLGDLFAFRILPALLATGLAIAVYFTALEVVRSSTLAAISGFFAGFIPELMRLTTNSLTKHNLTLLLFVLSIYYLIRLEKTKAALPWLILSSMLLTMFSPFAIIFVFVVWVYLGMLKIQGLEIQPKSFEFMLFITFLVLVVNHLAIIQTGIQTGIQGIVASLQGSTVSGYGINWVSLLSGINVVVLLLGIWGAYLALTKETKKREAALFISIALAIILMGLFGVLDLSIVLCALGVTFSITAAYSLESIIEYFAKLRLSGHLLLFGFFLVILAPVALSGLYEGLDRADASVQASDVAALLWLKNNSGSYSVVLAPVEYGHLITHFADRRDMIDTNQIIAKEAEQRIREVSLVYTTQFETEAMKILDRYNVNYILLNPEIASRFKISGLGYANDKECFDLVYNRTMEIYWVKCRLS